MKLNRPSKRQKEAIVLSLGNLPLSTTSSTVPSSINDFFSSMNEIKEVVETAAKASSLMSALIAYPFGFSKYDTGLHHEVHAQSTDYEFPVSILAQISKGVYNVLERHFNEISEKDVREFFDIIEKSLDPDMVMDVEALMNRLTEFMDSLYPDPIVDTFHSFNGMTMQQKDYYLPGLKVLHWDKKKNVFVSPVYPAQWENFELTALHSDRGGGRSIFFQDSAHQSMKGIMETCDCGIYASVNMKEMWDYCHVDNGSSMYYGAVGHYDKEDRRLCIIEPCSDAVVWIARKGWKAEHAFISEVIGETISVEDATNLLSMVWRRNVDVASLLKPRKAEL